MLERAVDEFGDRTFGELTGDPGILIIDLGVLDRDLGVDQLILSAAESSSQTTSPFLTFVPSGLIMMMVVVPFTLLNMS